MKQTTESRILKEYQKLKEAGKDFSPAQVAKNLGLTAKEITSFLRQKSPEVFLKRKAHARHSNDTRFSVATEPCYYPSVWGFV